MKSTLPLLILLSCFPFLSRSQDTFSICAYDSVTGQLGSAGATCIQATTSAIIISDVVAGKGVVHTQAAWVQANKTYAHSLLLLGLTPQQIIDSVVANDVQGNSTIRQYGVVDVNGASAAFTGTGCMPYANHITGPGYSIQGNILLGPQILDSMESRFLNTPGDLACRLMAALQGAKVVGADTRCTNLGISSVSSFIRVANPGDTGTTPLYLNLSVNTYPIYTEPIDSLQQLFLLWGGCGPNQIASPEEVTVSIFPNPAGNSFILEYNPKDVTTVEICNLFGTVVMTDFPKRSINSPRGTTSQELDISELRSGVYLLRLNSGSGTAAVYKIVKL